MQRIVIADVKSQEFNGTIGGHYIPLAQNYLDIFQNTCGILVGGGAAFKSYFNDSQIFLLPFNVKRGANPVINKLKVLLNCRFLFKQASKNDIIVLQHSGASTTFMGIALFAKKKNNIFVIQYDTNSISSSIKRLIYMCAKKYIKGFLCPNERIGEAFQRPYCVVTDYLFTGDSLPKTPRFDNRKYDFSIVGTLHRDKGVIEVAKQLANTNCSLLIAGKASEEDAETLRNIADSAQNIELKLGFVSEEEYISYLRNSKYSILNYRGVYFERSSGVVLDTLFNGVPVVGHRCPALQFVENEGIGVLFDNIEDLNICSLLKKDVHARYMEGLENYLKVQKDFKMKMLSFLNVGV